MTQIDTSTRDADGRARTVTEHTLGALRQKSAGNAGSLRKDLNLDERKKRQGDLG